MTLLKYFNNKRLFVIAMFVFSIPYIIFSFWNFPAADDYMIISKSAKYSFWELQKMVYYNWTGRYAATFISSIFSYNGFLYSHYYLHALLLFIFTVLSWLFCLQQVNKHVLSNSFQISALVLISFFMLVLELIIIPEPVTAFYWFSSAVTYQLPLILILIIIGLVIKLLSANGFKWTTVLTASILIICINGFNEIITLFLLVTSALLLAIYFKAYKRIPAGILVLYVITIIGAAFLIFAPGISERSSLMHPGSLVTIILIAFTKFIVLHWFFLKEPLWWFLLLFLCLFFSKKKGMLLPGFIEYKKISIKVLLSFYVLSGLLIYLPVLYVTNGSLPLRAENIICFLYSVISLMLASIIISNKSIKMFSSDSILYRYRFLFLSILIFSNSNMKRVTDSLLSGYLYNVVMRERLSILEDAKRTRRNEVTFDNYETAVSKLIKEKYTILNRQVLKDIILKPPPIICLENNLNETTFLSELYGIKKLVIQKNN